jgi:hypothetical protein
MRDRVAWIMSEAFAGMQLPGGGGRCRLNGQLCVLEPPWHVQLDPRLAHHPAHPHLSCRAALMTDALRSPHQQRQPGSALPYMLRQAAAARARQRLPAAGARGCRPARPWLRVCVCADNRGLACARVFGMCGLQPDRGRCAIAVYSGAANSSPCKAVHDRCRVAAHLL